MRPRLNRWGICGQNYQILYHGIIIRCFRSCSSSWKLQAYWARGDQTENLLFSFTEKRNPGFWQGITLTYLNFINKKTQAFEKNKDFVIRFRNSLSCYFSDNIGNNNRIFSIQFIRNFQRSFTNHFYFFGLTNNNLFSGLNGRFNGITKGEFRKAAEDRIGHLGQNPAGI